MSGLPCVPASISACRHRGRLAALGLPAYAGPGLLVRLPVPAPLLLSIVLCPQRVLLFQGSIDVPPTALPLLIQLFAQPVQHTQQGDHLLLQQGQPLLKAQPGEIFCYGQRPAPWHPAQAACFGDSPLPSLAFLRLPIGRISKP